MSEFDPNEVSFWYEGISPDITDLPIFERYKPFAPVTFYEDGNRGEVGWYRSEVYEDDYYRFLYFEETSDGRIELRYRVYNPYHENPVYLNTVPEEYKEILLNDISIWQKEGILPNLGFDDSPLRQIEAEAIEIEDFHDLVPGEFYKIKDKVIKLKSAYYDNASQRWIFTWDSDIVFKNTTGLKWIKPSPTSKTPQHHIQFDEFIDLEAEDHITFSNLDSELNAKIFRLKRNHVETLAKIAEPQMLNQEYYYHETPEKFLAAVCLETLVYSRWLTYDQTDDSLEGFYERFGGEQGFYGYADAMDKIISIAGEEYFIDYIKQLLKKEFRGLHLSEHKKTPHKPHSDIDFAGTELFKAANDLIGHLTPISTKTHGGYGHLNGLPYFGDPSFWRYLAESKPSLFDEALAYVEKLSETPFYQYQGGLAYMNTTIHPAAVIKKYFPVAFTQLQKLRPGLWDDVNVEDAIMQGHHEFFASQQKAELRRRRDELYNF